MAEDGPADPAAAEQALVRQAKAGDMKAFETLVRSHQGRVRRQWRSLVRGDTARADDGAQDTFVLAWRQLPGFRGEARFATWLHRIAYTRFLMQQRAHRADPAVGAIDAADLPERAADDPDPALHIDVERAVAGLPAAERLAIEHCFRLDLSHAEAAAVLGLPLGTLKSQLARGKARLREVLVDWEPQGPP